MKKTVSIVSLFVCITILALSFSKTSDSYKAFERSFDEKGNYIGFSDLPSDYTFERAKNDGCFVQQDLHTFANEDLLDNFIKASSQKKDSRIRLVQFFTEDNSAFFTDLYYMNGYYYEFSPSSKGQKKEAYSYMLKLGRKGDTPPKDYRYIVLTNDRSLTYDMVKKALDSMLLHGQKPDKKIPKFVLVVYK